MNFINMGMSTIDAGAPAASLIKASCSWAFSYHFLKQPRQFEQLINWGLNNPDPFTPDGFAGQYPALNAFDSTQWAHKINARTLVITGDQDLILSPSLSEDLAKTIPNAQFYCFKNCGHLPMIEYPTLFVDIVKNFIQYTQSV